jgi:tripartite-type tricarboxylate transporter receptor subunit TctC
MRRQRAPRAGASAAAGAAFRRLAHGDSRCRRPFRLRQIARPIPLAVRSCAEPVPTWAENALEVGRNNPGRCDMRLLRVVAAGLAAVGLMSGPVRAQDGYPSKPVTIIVPYGAGGAVDLVARVVAEGLRTELGQPFIVDNRAGANGLVGMRAAAKAEPDGYTLILSSESNHIVLPLVDPKFPMDVVKEFTPISQSGEFQHALIVKSDIPAKSVKELVDYMKANPGKLSFGSSGVGTMAHVAGELLTKETGAGLVHVPYRGSAAAMSDLLAGTLDVNFQSMPALRSYRENARLRILATLSPVRLKDMPEIPTMVESGFPEFVLSSWMGMFGPAGLPDAIRDKLSAALVKVGQNPELQARLRGGGVEPVGSDAAAFARFLDAETAKWKTFVTRTGVTVSQ